MNTNDQTRKSSSISSRKSIGPAKFVKKDLSGKLFMNMIKYLTLERRIFNSLNH